MHDRPAGLNSGFCGGFLEAVTPPLWRDVDRDAGIRIDHLLLNRMAAKRLAATGVDRRVRAREKASDHAPTWVILRDR